MRCASFTHFVCLLSSYVQCVQNRFHNTSYRGVRRRLDSFVDGAHLISIIRGRLDYLNLYTYLLTHSMVQSPS